MDSFQKSLYVGYLGNFKLRLLLCEMPAEGALDQHDFVHQVGVLALDPPQSLLLTNPLLQEGHASSLSPHPVQEFGLAEACLLSALGFELFS